MVCKNKFRPRHDGSTERLERSVNTTAAAGMLCTTYEVLWSTVYEFISIACMWLYSDIQSNSSSPKLTHMILLCIVYPTAKERTTSLSVHLPLCATPAEVPNTCVQQHAHVHKIRHRIASKIDGTWLRFLRPPGYYHVQYEVDT